MRPDNEIRTDDDLTKEEWDNETDRRIGLIVRKALTEIVGATEDDLRRACLEKIETIEVDRATEYFRKTIIDPYIRPGRPGLCMRAPDLPYAISANNVVGVQNIILATRNEATCDLILKFLNEDLEKRKR